MTVGRLGGELAGRRKVGLGQRGQAATEGHGDVPARRWRSIHQATVSPVEKRMLARPRRGVERTASGAAAMCHQDQVKTVAVSFRVEKESLSDGAQRVVEAP